MNHFVQDVSQNICPLHWHVLVSSPHAVCPAHSLETEMLALTELPLPPEICTLKLWASGSGKYLG